MAVTLTEVAQAAGVSVSTASIAFSGAASISPETRDRVLRAAKALGYLGPNPMAASLRRGRSGVIGVVVNDDLRHSFRDPVLVQVLDGIAGELGREGYGMLLIPRLDSDGEAHPLLRSTAIDAAIMFYGVLPGDPAVATLASRKIPMIGMNSSLVGIPLVRVAERAGMRLIAEHLRERGHERIALATLPYGHPTRSGWAESADVPTHSVTAERLAGVRNAGIEPVAIWECRGSLVDEGITAGKELLALNPRPSAIIGFSDLIAAGIVLAAADASLDVPSDVAVAGFDGVDLPWLAGHKLTTIDQPRRDRGTQAAALAKRLAAGEDVTDLTLDVELVVGSTT